MKKFRIVLDGVAHEVLVEELGDAGSVKFAPAPQAAAPAVSGNASQQAASAVSAVSSSASADASIIKAPLQGTIFEIKVTEGQKVSAGDVLLTIEAMKMENEVVAPTDGTVGTIFTSKGSNVSVGTDLLMLK